MSTDEPILIMATTPRRKAFQSN